MYKKEINLTFFKETTAQQGQETELLTLYIPCPYITPDFVTNIFYMRAPYSTLHRIKDI